jgi:hypothetical protein
MNTENASKEDPGVEEVLDEIIDLEDYAKRGDASVSTARRSS